MRKLTRLLLLLVLLSVVFLGCTEHSISTGLVHGSMISWHRTEGSEASFYFYYLSSTKSVTIEVTEPITAIKTDARIGTGSYQVVLWGPDGSEIYRVDVDRSTNWEHAQDFEPGDYILEIASAGARLGRIAVTTR